MEARVKVGVRPHSKINQIEQINDTPVPVRSDELSCPPTDQTLHHT